MIEKKIRYKESDLVKHLKKLGLTEKEIKNILKKGASQKITERKNFDDGGDSGGDSGGNSAGDSAGDSGPGGSDDGSGHGGPGGQGDSGPGGSDDGTGHGGPGLGGFGDTFGSSTAQDQAANEAAAQAAAQAETEVTEVDMTPPAPQTIQEKVMAYIQSQMTPASLVGRAIGMTLAGPIGGIFGGLAGSNIGRGVTGPNDYSQATTSVQTSAPTQSPGGGSNYLPINANTGIPSLSPSSNFVDDFYNRYRANLNRFS